MIRVIILDDHQLFIDGIVNSFINDSEIEIVGFSNDGTTGLKLINKQNPDVVILDIDFRNTQENGVDILKIIKKTNTTTKVLILTGYCDKSLIEELQSEGANGYRLKNIDFEELRQTILAIYKGKYVFTYDFPNITKKYISAQQISVRALEVIKLLSKGLIVKEISSELGIAETTIYDHIERAKHKLGAKNNVELVFLATKSGLL
jgi:DNA-binding NarL/FixJ family response regulator